MDALIELFSLSHLYLGGGVGYVRELPELPASLAYKWDQNRVANPLGIVTLGYRWDERSCFGEITTRIEMRHQSFVGVDDHGQDSFQLMIEWRPFRR